MKPLSNLAVLVVEDDPMEAARLESALSRLGCIVTLAHDGDTALVALAGARFDAMLLDLVLPGLDGMGVLRAMSARGSLVPVVAAVTTAGMDAAADAVRAGARDFVVKPAGALRLQVALANAVALSGAHAAGAAAGGAGGLSAANPPAPILPGAVVAAAPPAARDVRLDIVGQGGHVRPLAEIADEAIGYAIARYDGRLTEVARRLGIGRSTLYRRVAGRSSAATDHLLGEPAALQFVAAE